MIGWNNNTKSFDFIEHLRNVVDNLENRSELVPTYHNFPMTCSLCENQEILVTDMLMVSPDKYVCSKCEGKQ